MFTVLANAFDVKIERVLLDVKPPFLGDLDLPFFDFSIKKFFNRPAFKAYEMIVVPALVELEDRLASLEVVTLQQPGLFELGQDAINRCQADVHAFAHQGAVNVFGGEVALIRMLEKVENFQPGIGGLQAYGL